MAATKAMLERRAHYDRTKAELRKLVQDDANNGKLLVKPNGRLNRSQYCERLSGLVGSPPGTLINHPEIQSVFVEFDKQIKNGKPLTGKITATLSKSAAKPTKKTEMPQADQDTDLNLTGIQAVTEDMLTALPENTRRLILRGQDLYRKLLAEATSMDEQIWQLKAKLSESQQLRPRLETLKTTIVSLVNGY